MVRFGVLKLLMPFWWQKPFCHAYAKTDVCKRSWAGSTGFGKKAIHGKANLWPWPLKAAACLSSKNVLVLFFSNGVFNHLFEPQYLTSWRPENPKPRWPWKHWKLMEILQAGFANNIYYICSNSLVVGVLNQVWQHPVAPACLPGGPSWSCPAPSARRYGPCKQCQAATCNLAVPLAQSKFGHLFVFWPKGTGNLQGEGLDWIHQFIAKCGQDGTLSARSMHHPPWWVFPHWTKSLPTRPGFVKFCYMCGGSWEVLLYKKIYCTCLPLADVEKLLFQSFPMVNLNICHLTRREP